MDKRGVLALKPGAQSDQELPAGVQNWPEHGASVMVVGFVAWIGVDN
jgi:hypothetical protein